MQTIITELPRSVTPKINASEIRTAAVAASETSIVRFFNSLHWVLDIAFREDESRIGLEMQQKI